MFFRDGDIVLDTKKGLAYGTSRVGGVIYTTVPTITVHLVPTDAIIGMAGLDREPPLAGGEFTFTFNPATPTRTDPGIIVRYPTGKGRRIDLKRSALCEIYGILDKQVARAFGRSIGELLERARTVVSTGNASAVCDKCGYLFSAEVGEIAKGSLICQYIQCPECGTAVQVSVTDPKLRKMVARCSSLETPPEKRQKLLADCVDRTRKLKRYFPMEKFLDPEWNPG